MQKSKSTAAMPPPPVDPHRKPDFLESSEDQLLKNPSKTEEEKKIPEESVVISGRERLKRHRVDVAGRVWIPDMWGQESFLKDWSDCAKFDASLVNSRIMSARDSLVEEGRRASSTRLRLETS